MLLPKNYLYQKDADPTIECNKTSMRLFGYDDERRKSELKCLWEDKKKETNAHKQERSSSKTRNSQIIEERSSENHRQVHNDFQEKRVQEENGITQRTKWTNYFILGMCNVHVCLCLLLISRPVSLTQSLILSPVASIFFLFILRTLCECQHLILQ